jgi:hypothetical protein
VIVQPDVKARLEDAGAVVTPMSVVQFKDFVRGESAKYLRVIKQTGVTSQKAAPSAVRPLFSIRVPMAPNPRFFSHFRLT